MDASVFDRLRRTVGGGSRRIALRTALSGATVAAAGLLSSRGGSEAKKKCKKKKCPTCTPKAIGASCESAKECCGSDTGLSCAKPNDAGPAGPPVCCGTEGTACTSRSQCCDGFECAPFCTRG